MTEHRVSLRMPYHQAFKLYRGRKKQFVHLSAPFTVLIREIDAAEAPVAYRVMTDDEYASQRMHEVRSFESTFLWPLMAPDGPVSTVRFIEIAADGRLGAFLAFGRAAKVGHHDGRTFEEFFNEFPLHRYLEDDREHQSLLTSRGAARLLFCDGYVYVKAGAPLWYAAERFDLNRIDVWLGHEFLDRTKTNIWTAGPDRHMQRYCCQHSRAYGLDEIGAEIKRIAGAHMEVRVRSRIEILMDLHLPEGAARLCAQTLAETVWRCGQVEAVRAAVPLLAAAEEAKAMPQTIDPFLLLEQYSRFEDRTPTRRYSITITAAKDIVRRLQALGCTPLAQEDDDALAALG
jgi:hypothetical protein